MHKLKFNGAVAACEVMRPTGLAEVEYSGKFSQVAFDTLRTDALALTRNATSYVLRVDRAVIVPDADLAVPEAAYPPDTPAGALVVRPDQLEQWLSYARTVAREHGVMRAVFLTDQLGLAYEWALRQAVAGKPGSQQ